MKSSGERFAVEDAESELTEELTTCPTTYVGLVDLRHQTPRPNRRVPVRQQRLGPDHGPQRNAAWVGAKPVARHLRRQWIEHPRRTAVDATLVCRRGKRLLQQVRAQSMRPLTPGFGQPQHRLDVLGKKRMPSGGPEDGTIDRQRIPLFDLVENAVPHSAPVLLPENTCRPQTSPMSAVSAIINDRSGAMTRTS